MHLPPTAISSNNEDILSLWKSLQTSDHPRSSRFTPPRWCRGRPGHRGSSLCTPQGVLIFLNLCLDQLNGCLNKKLMFSSANRSSGQNYQPLLMTLENISSLIWQAMSWSKCWTNSVYINWCCDMMLWSTIQSVMILQLLFEGVLDFFDCASFRCNLLTCSLTLSHRLLKQRCPIWHTLWPQDSLAWLGPSDILSISVRGRDLSLQYLQLCERSFLSTRHFRLYRHWNRFWTISQVLSEC